MSALFAQNAIENMKDFGLTARETSRLFVMLERIARNPSILEQSEDIIHVRKEHEKNAFIVRSGNVRAILTIDAARPKQIIIVKVYRAGEGAEEEQSNLDKKL